KYTLKNSKGYRYSWGKQVRSMMGTAVEGKNVGSVRFLIEVAPNGQMTKLQTLWSTSDYVENLARKVMKKMPPLPPTPTGKSLVFEKTISFSPFVSDIPPLYKNDCHPDMPAYRNPFAWDGISEQKVETVTLRPHLTEQELAECEKQLPKDVHDAESAYNQVTTKRWGAGSSGK
ncbi:MAG TPA: energy transducer TonB, partial [Burkholderiaceae bacterium]|nr:energy transducer TonB [Burkholderiaceae bacterium]